METGPLHELCMDPTVASGVKGAPRIPQLSAENRESRSSEFPENFLTHFKQPIALALATG